MSEVCQELQFLRPADVDGALVSFGFEHASYVFKQDGTGPAAVIRNSNGDVANVGDFVRRDGSFRKAEASDRKRMAEPSIVTAWREAVRERSAPTDDERFEQWWNEDPRRIDQNHLKLSARIGWNGALQVARETTDWLGVAQNAWKDGHMAELTERAERGERLRAELQDLFIARTEEANGWQKAYEWAVREGTDLKRENDHLLRTIDSLRAKLADANAREANHVCQPCHPGGSCHAVMDEALRQRDVALEALRRLQATGQSIIDIAKNGMRE